MKILYTILFIAAVSSLFAQAIPGNPNVPIDGGLTLILAAGAGIGYKAYQKRNRQKK